MKKITYIPRVLSVSQIPFSIIILFLAVNCSLITVNCFTQSITWQRTYDFYPYFTNDNAYSVCSTTDGNFIIAGSGGQGKICAIKINSFGDTLWTRQYPNGLAYAVAQTDDGGCIITGYGDTSKVFALRIDFMGNLLWNRSYGGTDARLYSLVKCLDGNYIACGRDWRTNKDGIIIKFDQLGNLIWEKYYLAGYDKSLLSISETQNQRIIVSGIDMATNSSQSYIYLMKLNNAGDTVWTKQYDINSSGCYGKDLVVSSNSYTIAGPTGDSTGMSYQWQYFINTDTNGNIIYKKIFSRTNYEYYLTFAKCNSGYILCTSNLINPSHISATLYLTDFSGQIRFQKRLNDTGQAEINRVLPLVNGDFLNVGYSYFDDTTHENFFVTRTDSLLNFPTIGIINYSNSTSSEFELFPNFPNPFNPTTKIKYELKVKSLITIEIFDISGKKVETLVNKEQSAGSYSIEWNAENSASGIYFLCMTTSGFKDTRKMILLK